MQPEAVSPTDAARMLGLGLTKTYDLMNQRTLTSTKIGRRRLVHVDSIRALLSADKVAA